MTAARELTMPIRTVSETNQREHWARRHRRRASQRWTARLHMLARAVPLQKDRALPCAVTMTRIAPSTGLDDDNLRGALKAVRDGIADALGVDDADPRVSWAYEQRRGGRGEYAVLVRIERRDGV